MRTYLGVVVASALTAASAVGLDYVNEDFEGSFPPAGWTTAYGGTGNASWSQASGGPEGKYASGSASSFGDGLVWATFMSPEFNVKGNTTVYYRFDYGLWGNGHGVEGGEFYIVYADEPARRLQYRELEGLPSWAEFAGSAAVSADDRFKACWRVWADDYWRYHFAFLFIDDVIIADQPRHPAVEPASVGRVKALFR